MNVSMIRGALDGFLKFATRFLMISSTSFGVGSNIKIASEGVILSMLSCFMRFTNDSATLISLGIGLKQIKIILI